MSETSFRQPPDTHPEGTLGHSLAQRRIVRFDPGHAVIEYEVLPAICHSGGVAQGGFVAGWIDAAMAHAVMAKFGVERVSISLEIKVSFYEKVGPGEGWVEGRVVRRGKRVAFLEAALYNAQGKLAAEATSTGLLADI
jgi:uncharacterized protein (TIGR00369 family)